MGNWIRPVSSRNTEEISKDESRFEDGKLPSVLDIIRIPMLEHRPKWHQSENHLIGRGSWEWVRRASWQEVVGAIDPVQGTLWENGHHSRNDRIPAAKAKQLKNSLLLIMAENIVIRQVPQKEQQARATFNLNGEEYDLVVTDPEIEQHLLKMTDSDEYTVPKAALCISLGKIFEGDYIPGHAYKLVASVITEKRARQVQ